MNERTFDDINFSFREKNAKTRILLILNPEEKTHWIYNRFFKGKLDDGKDIPDEFNGVIGNVRYIHTTYLDNLNNLDENFLQEVENLKNSNLKKYNHQFLGHWQDELETCLFKSKYIQRQDNIPQLKKIVVAVDPAVTSNKNSDETGIIVAGMDHSDNFYVLEDASLKGTPIEWANRVNEVYQRWSANIIVAERNQGGDLVTSNIRTVNKNLPIKTIHAKHSKILRAEPIASLYEQGRVFHIGIFPKLEFQMTTYVGTGSSPDRLDALVYALQELSDGKRYITPSFVNSESKIRFGIEKKISEEDVNIDHNNDESLWQENDFEF